MTEKKDLITTDEPRALATRLSEIDPELLRLIRRNQNVHCLRQLMTNLKMDADSALLVLQIPKRERDTYRAILSNNKKYK